MRRDEVDESVIDQSRLSRRDARVSTCQERMVEGAGHYVEHIDPALVDKEALKQALDDDQALAENQHHGVHPGAPAMEDEKKGKLRQECEGEKNEVHQEGDDGQGQQAADEQGMELPMASEVVDAAQRIRGRPESPLRIAP